MTRIPPGQRIIRRPAFLGHPVIRKTRSITLAGAVATGILTVAPFLIFGCSRPLPDIQGSLHQGLVMENVAFEKALLTKYLPTYNPQYQQQSFYIPFTINYAYKSVSTSARIQLSAERHAVGQDHPSQESLIRVHWEYKSGDYNGQTIDLLIGDNKMYVETTIAEINQQANPTRAGLRFIADNILTPLRESDLNLPAFFHDIDGKIQEIVKEF